VLPHRHLFLLNPSCSPIFIQGAWMKNFLEFEVSPYEPPRNSGVYGVFICNFGLTNKKLVYIGSSSNIHKRVLTPKHPYMLLFRRFPHRIVFTASLECENYIEEEKRLINKYHPVLNKTYGSCSIRGLSYYLSSFHQWRKR